MAVVVNPLDGKLVNPTSVQWGEINSYIKLPFFFTLFKNMSQLLLLNNFCTTFFEKEKRRNIIFEYVEDEEGQLLKKLEFLSVL